MKPKCIQCSKPVDGVDMTYKELAEREVLWYRKHGRFPNRRIKKDANGIEYVIGDFSWNLNIRQCPMCKQPNIDMREVIEPRMSTRWE